MKIRDDRNQRFEKNLDNMVLNAPLSNYHIFNPSRPFFTAFAKSRMCPYNLFNKLNIFRVSKEAKLELEEDEYVERFKPFMMDIVHEWCKGSSFKDIIKMTDMFEGSIIRSMRMLEELLRQMVQASKNIGNSELEVKFSEAIRLLKRDIVFAASLYL